MLRVCSFESRRAEDIRSLIERNGGVATVAPSMREVPLERNDAAFAYGDLLLAGQIDLMVFMTGVGARALLDVLETRQPRNVWFDAWNRIPIALRGPKPAVVLREWNVRIDYRAPEPNTWKELLAVLLDNVDLNGKTVGVQEYGQPSVEFCRSLTDRGASIVSAPVYRWELPEDVAPLELAVRRIAACEFDAVLVTSAQQIRHALLIASQLNLEAEFRAGMNAVVVGSIGPTASEALDELDFRATFEPSHPKMGTLVKELFERFPK